MFELPIFLPGAFYARRNVVRNSWTCTSELRSLQRSLPRFSAYLPKGFRKSYSTVHPASFSRDAQDFGGKRKTIRGVPWSRKQARLGPTRIASPRLGLTRFISVSWLTGRCPVAGAHDAPFITECSRGVSDLARQEPKRAFPHPT